jgi:hypothetical protein
LCHFTGHGLFTGTVFAVGWWSDAASQGWRGNIEIAQGQIREVTTMEAQIFGLRVASILFGLMSISRLGRLILRPELAVDGHITPLWPSALAFAVLGGLSFWLWKLAGMQPRQDSRGWLIPDKSHSAVNREEEGKESFLSAGGAPD